TWSGYDGLTVTGAAALSTGTVTLNSNGSNILFNSTLAGGSQNLVITGNVVFGNEATDTVTGLGTLSVSGTTTINTSNVTSSGTQTYTGDVTLGVDTTLTTTNSAVTFSGTVNSEATESNDLTINAGSGDITFGAAVGAAVN
ncbi:hypothetical protein ACQV5M_22195, partial [Leptospira sp. SA-E8]|uniref:hypothetical protein n=1 Tax=Leptospira sp. SA-E8 TaxID=3422259 RepID=UPI003EBA1547